MSYFSGLFGIGKKQDDGKPRFIIVDEGTIRESCDEGDNRTRKRQRVDSDSSDRDNIFRFCPKVPLRPSLRPDVDGTEILIHDPTYYYAEDPQADCYVRVEKIIFKIHGHLLHMSKLLTSRVANRPAPTSGKDPLELFGVSVNEFRALLWARYASEEDAKDQPKAREDLERLLYLATVAKSLEFYELHEWAIQSMQKAFTANIVLTDTCSSANFTRVIEIATQYKATDLLDAAVSTWSDRVRRRDIPAVPAILAADTHKLPQLRGIAYYTHLLEAIEQSPPGTPTTLLRFQADPKLSDKQVIRLLAGHFSLVNFTERYRRCPVKLDRAEDCSTEAHRACTLVWSEQWQAAAGSRKVLGHSSADILGIFSGMSEQLNADVELVEGVTSACRLAGLESLKRNVVDARESLPQYFLGCL
ncbi:hypothetical protein D9615_006697 [Tricholomella constricta]|uniref:BTB domain-containing protein n=1 Tax=Tricholomella constricta TaxID=117010 RepID=A0A8H5M1Z1_9AGAR|nr:hypothetical protein D9615_006697 [Tricholomella constricta]